MLLVVALYLLALPYLALMLLVFAGLFRDGREPRSERRPSVAVVIPAHDEEDELGATLASLSAQRYPGPAEFVIIDDRSSDGTAEVIRAAAERDPRIRLLRVFEPSRRLSPKVNAVERGIEASQSEIIITSDADCQYPEGWLEGMVEHFAPDVVMVVGYVESTRKGGASRWLHRFESIDWFSLMVVARSLTRFGWKFASSANNQAYRRDAFEAAGGFGAPGRAPSGDEDLLTQRLGRLPGSRIVFASRPETRVLTRPIASWSSLLRQRRRWVSRYHHVMHYHPGFLASIAVLGFQSVLLSVAVLSLPFLPELLPWVAAIWGLEMLVQLAGLWVGGRQLGREDLSGLPALGWALLHPFFIGTIVLWSLTKSGEWRAGAEGYRRRFFLRRWRSFVRRLRPGIKP